MSADDPAPEAEAPDSGKPAQGSVNSQILDALAAIEAAGAEQGKAQTAAMLNLASAHAAALGMYNMVARQQADAAIASATVAALSARMVGTQAVAAGAVMPPVPGLAAAAAAQAQAAISILKGLAAGEGDEAAQAQASLKALAEEAGTPAAPGADGGDQPDARRRGTRRPAAPPAGS